MPRTILPRGMLGAATPGLSRLAAALGGGGQGAYQDAHDKELSLQSKLAQTLAAARESEAQADDYTAKAAHKRAETGFLERRPQLYEEQAALASGTSVPLVQALRKFVATGERAQVPMGPPTEDGQMGVGSQQFDPEQQTRVTQQLQRLLPLLAGAGDIKVDDWAKAQGAYREQDLGDQVLAGARPAADVGRSQAAIAGKPLFNSDASGAVLDLFAGGLNVDNPMAQGSIAVKKETAGAQRANAVQSYASADSSRASAAKTRAEMVEGTNRGGAKAPTGYRWAKDGQTLEPVPGGPADPATKGAKLAKPPTEGQAKALMFGSRMAVADEILGELAEQGALHPGRLKQAAETIPIVGGAAAMGVNMLPPALGGPNSRQQQVEQAQRDFINAVLRRESGAVISDQEFRNAARQYFPMPGDENSPEVLAQKAAARRTAIAGMKAEFGEQSLPEFEQIVSQARSTRKAPPSRKSGGTVQQAAGAAPAPQQQPQQAQRNVVVDF
jgi:hypothetical protein